MIEKDTLNIKIIDFAFCIKQKFKRQEYPADCGTPNYMAPEIIQKIDSWPQPADMWAFGVILFKLSTGKFPFVGKFILKLIFYRKN